MWVRYECHIVSVSRLLLSVTFIPSGLKEERTRICHSFWEEEWMGSLVMFSVGLLRTRWAPLDTGALSPELPFCV